MQHQKIMLMIKFTDPSKRKNTAHVHFSDKTLNNVRYVKVNSMPAVGEHLTANFYVHQALSNCVIELSFIRLGPDENIELDKKSSKVPNFFVDNTQNNNRNNYKNFL